MSALFFLIVSHFLSYPAADSHTSPSSCPFHSIPFITFPFPCPRFVCLPHRPSQFIIVPPSFISLFSNPSLSLPRFAPFSSFFLFSHSLPSFTCCLMVSLPSFVLVSLLSSAWQQSLLSFSSSFWPRLVFFLTIAHILLRSTTNSSP